VALETVPHIDDIFGVFVLDHKPSMVDLGSNFDLRLYR